MRTQLGILMLQDKVERYHLTPLIHIYFIMGVLGSPYSHASRSPHDICLHKPTSYNIVLTNTRVLRCSLWVGQSERQSNLEHSVFMNLDICSHAEDRAVVGFQHMLYSSSLLSKRVPVATYGDLAAHGTITEGAAADSIY
jgi:hypothetical protein